MQVLLGGALFFGFLVALPMFIWKKYKEKSGVLKQMGALKFATMAVLFLMMAGLPIKMFLRLAFNIKYIWVFGVGHDLFFNI